ncbi:MAG: hypothetical protein GC168_03690 [Candidatus Hydrogenedens sp.]|nr:hypothetical protein [Candidatus Hydrogenedens sp.]
MEQGPAALTVPRIAGLLGLLIIGGIVGVIAVAGRPDIPLDELVRRCAQSTPTWDSYQEDIKGQIGAAPVAEWHGEPVWARHEGAVIEVAFSVSPPWNDYPCSLPMLLRDPFGEVHLARQAENLDGVFVYRFELRSNPDAGLPWVEIHYPHQERRLSLRSDGTWGEAG